MLIIVTLPATEGEEKGVFLSLCPSQLVERGWWVCEGGKGNRKERERGREVRREERKGERKGREVRREERKGERKGREGMKRRERRRGLKERSQYLYMHTCTNHNCSIRFISSTESLESDLKTRHVCHHTNPY